uniref:non-specific serine/threonine protein kinase n=1 Tax=Strongyloides stercoralis TaxID=6248 RepID=A0AAF5DMX8_STRER
MPGAPRFIQKPSIQQTPQGDLLMECNLEADPLPEIVWHHSGTPIVAGGRVQLSIQNVSGIQYKAILIIKEPNAGDGGAYKCTASNQLGESNANINLNFAGGADEQRGSNKGPTFIGKPRIIPKDGGALILMECRVKSTSRPVAKWFKDGALLPIGGLFQDVFTDLGDNAYLCQLEIRKPTANDAGQYRCTIKNDQGETNANLTLNFEQEPPQDDKTGRRSPSVNKDGRKSRTPSRPGTPLKKKDKEKSERNKSREGTPKKSTRSRTATPTKELRDSEKMDVDGTHVKRRSDAPLPPKEKKSRQRSVSPAVSEQTQINTKAKKQDESKNVPIVVEHIKAKTIKVGDSTTISCKFQCHKSTKVLWYKDGKVITSSSEYTQSFDGTTAKLNLNRVTQNNSGIYKAVAKSDYGETESSAKITVEQQKKDDNLLDVKSSSRRTSKDSTITDKSESELLSVAQKRNSSSVSPAQSMQSLNELEVPKKTSRKSSATDNEQEKSKLSESAVAPKSKSLTTKDDVDESSVIDDVNLRRKMSTIGFPSIEAKVKEWKKKNYDYQQKKYDSKEKIMLPPLETIEQSRRKSMSDIHAFVLTKLPTGHARHNILKHMIDLETPAQTENSSILDDDDYYLSRRKTSLGCKNIGLQKCRSVTSTIGSMFENEKNSSIKNYTLPIMRKTQYKSRSTSNIHEYVLSKMVDGCCRSNILFDILDLAIPIPSEKSSIHDDMSSLKEWKSIAQLRPISLSDNKIRKLSPVPPLILTRTTLRKSSLRNASIPNELAHSNSLSNMIPFNKTIVFDHIIPEEIESAIKSPIRTTPSPKSDEKKPFFDSSKQSNLTKSVNSNENTDNKTKNEKQYSNSPLKDNKNDENKKLNIKKKKKSNCKSLTNLNVANNDNNTGKILKNNEIDASNNDIKKNNKNRRKFGIYNNEPINICEMSILDEIPASGLKISPERRRELLRLSGQGDSDDEITESISELPSISTSAKPRSAKKSVKLAIDEESAGMPATVVEKVTKKSANIEGQLTLSKVEKQTVAEESHVTVSTKKIKKRIVKKDGVVKSVTETGDESIETTSQKSVSTSLSNEKSISKKGKSLKTETSSKNSIIDDDDDKSERLSSVSSSKKSEVSSTSKFSVISKQVETKKRPLKTEENSSPFAVKLKKTPKKKENDKEEKDGHKLNSVNNNNTFSQVGRGSDSTDSSRNNSIFEFSKGKVAELKKSQSGNVRRSSVDMRRGSVSFAEVTEKESTPLKPKGPKQCPARIIEIPENVTVAENETAVFKCKVEGDPAPTFKWYKGKRELINGPRIKIMTDGKEGEITLVIGKCRSQDDGQYTLNVENKFGTDSSPSKLLVTAESGLDFRSMLKSRDSMQIGSANKDKPEEMTPDARRMSLFPGKKVEKWDQPLEDTTCQQQVNKMVELKCVYSRPNAKIRWYKDKKEIFSGGLKYRINIEKNQTTLVINNPEVEDTGNYICEANGIKTNCQLTVLEPPLKCQFIIPLPNTQEVFRTKKAELSCKVNTSKAPLVWIRNGKEVSPDDPRFIIEKDAVGRFTLTIKEVIESDHCEWIAKVSNEVKSKVMVYVEEPRQTFVVPLKSQKVTEKEDATMECDVNDRDAEVEWFHDGEKIHIDGKRYIEERVGRKRRLTITNTKPDDAGEIKCTTKDDKSICQLIVEALNKFIVKLKDMDVIEHSDITLRCETKDTKTPGIWMKNGKTIQSMPGGKFETTSRNGVHILKIKHIEICEADTYEIDSAGLIGSCKINVLEAEKKPVLNWKPKKIDAQAGKPEVIQVPFSIKGTRTGDPKVRLMKDGKPVDLNAMKDLVEVVIVGDVAEIRFKNPKKEDTGKWALELSNTGGTALAPFDFNVRDKPKPPKGPLETKNVTAEGCDLKWDKNEGDEQPHKYVVEMQEGRSGNWVKIGEAKGTEFKVKDLKENGEYKFRVKAVNDVGSSDPLTGESILARNPYETPGKPRQMEAVDINKDSLTLQWSPPDNDGGAPITSYIVERREKSEKEWNVVGETPADPNSDPGTKHQLVDDKVVEGKEYYYRVKAVNKAGQGDPCDHGRAFKIKAKPAEPKFTDGGLKDLYLKVGETIKYELKIAGEPLPEVSWTVNGKPLKIQGRVKLSTERGRTILKIENALRSDTGAYTIKLKNASGECTSTGNVTVVGKPTPPKGPLKAKDINAEGLTLEWQLPDDDGGVPLEGFIIEAQDLDEKGKFVQVGSVGPGETAAVIKGLKNKGNYKFRVKAINKEGESDPLVADDYILVKNPWDEPGKPGRPEIVDVDSDNMTLQWDPPMKDGGAPIEEYIIEMKDPETKEWVQVATSPTTSAKVTGLKEGKDYQFRVKAVNKAGPGHPSEPSEKRTAKPKFVPAWLNHDDLKDLVVKAGQSAKWDVKIGGEPHPTVVWEKNDKVIDKNDNILIETHKNEHTILCISSAVRSDRGLYKLSVKNSCGQDASSANLVVVDKPSKPRGPLEVSNVFENECDLEWKAPEDDGGEPIEYYEVEKLDVDTGRWVPAAKVKGTQAHIQGLKKGQSYQFRVKAVNKEGASAPLNTENATVAKNPYHEPGKPSQPDITDWDTDRVSLKWDPPDSDGGAPITQYIIEKKNKHSRDWQECGKVTGQDTEATITGLKEGEEYQFRVIAVNKAGPGEPSDSSKKVIAKARNLKPHIDRDSMKTITIKVGQNVDFDVPVRGEPPPELVWTFNDKPLEMNNKHIRIQNEDYRTQFALRNSTRAHAGRYTLTATNINGTDSHYVDIIVLSRPSKPMGPLEVSEIFEDKCTLDWKPPEDDGGIPIDHYEIEKMDLATGRWVPCGRSDGTKAEVQNLQPGHSYQFRVRAVNKEGESDPLTTDAAILAKNPYEVPEKVKKPEIVDWDKDHVDLKWEKPDDGGSPIEAYIIEKKDKNGRWSEAAVVPGDQTDVVITNVTPGEEYQFRVSAKNKAGVGEASDPSDSVICKPRNLPPHIHREDLEDVVVKVGQGHKFIVHIDGEPAPSVTWTCDGKPLQNIQIDNEDYISKFNILKASRKQSGKYTITATNINGSDSVTIEIKVKGRPSKPKGPLEVSDVTEDSCHLDWQPPEDDGGEPVQYYEVERMDTRDGVWVPVGRAANCSLDVDGLNKGSHYKFRVKAVNSEGKSDELETEDSILAKNPFDRPGKPENAEAVDWDVDHVDIKWDPPLNDGGSPITEYKIEKRTKYGRWEDAIAVPSDSTAATIPDLTPGEEYEFRVVAINKGGASDPSDATKPVITKPRNLPPKIDRKNLKKTKIRSGQMVTFDVNVEGEPAPTIVWTNNNGSEIRNGGRVKLENSDYKTKLQMRNCERDMSGTYEIRAENCNGEDVATVEILVVDKPLAPEGPLVVSDVFADNVTLAWKPPKDDGGEPIENYMIEKLDTATGSWLPATKVDGDTTTAKVEGLIPGHEYKFRVAAVNAEGESEPLETFEKVIAKNPFDVAGKPGKPEITDWDKDFADLQWTPPLDDGGAPIEEYIIEMKEKYSPLWTEAAIVPGDKTSGRVENLKEGNEYEFRIRAKNKAGKGSPSEPSDTMIAKSRNVPPKIDKNSIHEIKVKAGQAFDLDIPISGEPTPVVTWNFEGTPVENSDRMKVVNNEEKTKFIVKRAARGDTGTYIIKAENVNGTDTAEVNVTVVDRPSEPRGPLDISDINENGCTLAWKPPTDDGGAEISHYVVEKQDTNTGRWSNCGEAIDTNFVVDDLIKGHEYKFRVKAVNKYGESDPLESNKPIIAKNPFDKADRPGTPIITDWDKDFADIEWAPPNDDGGAKIEGYQIEKRLVGGDWEDCGEVNGDTTKAKVENLIPGKTYQFRVKALNKAGESLPSDPSRELLAKTRRLPPKIDRETLFDIKIKKGGIIDFDVNVEGEPSPKIQWLLNTIPLTVSSRTKIDDSQANNTKLKTYDAERIDSGVYKIIATNEYGKDEAEVNVVVLDVPGTPRGPLDVGDVTKDSAVVSWREPEDDGGSPISHYVVEKQEDNGRWVPCGETSDTKIKVPKLNEGHEYKFRVKAVNKQGESVPLTQHGSTIAKNPFDKPGKPQDVDITDWDKDKMTVEWKPPINDGGAPIQNYIVEKKDSLGQWVECATVPGDQTNAIVDNLIPGETYQFRVKAVNKGGVGEPSDASRSQIAKPRKLAPKIDLSGLLDQRIRAGNPVNINVFFEGEPEPETTWLINNVAPSERVLVENKNHTSKITIFSSIRSDSGSYHITVQNEYGKQSASCNITILDVPGVPEGPLKATDINKEGCKLSWKPPLDNGGSEIIGYIVEKMDTSRGTWQEVGEFVDCNAVIKGLTNGKTYQFRVKAVNLEGESKPLEGDEDVLARDQFEVPSPPGQPKVIDWDVDRIDIKWTPPEDNGGDPIKEYVIERREKGSTLWVESGTVDGKTTEFSAAGLRKGAEYEFRVVAANNAGYSDPSEPSQGQIAKARYVKPKITTQQRKYKVKAGYSLSLNVEFIGSPDPEVLWKLNGTTPLPSELLLDNKEGLTTIFYPCCKRSDSSNYHLTISNELGKDEGIFELIVQDKPSPPEGPLVIENVTKSGCKLSWNPPKDDGGSEITNYVVERRDIKNQSWVPVNQFCTGTTYTVSKLHEGHDYEFRIIAENALGQSLPLVSDSPTTMKDPYGTPGKPGKPKIVDSDYEFIELVWSPPSDDGGSPIGHYDIERKDQKSGRWIKVNTSPVHNTKFTDSNVQKDHGYEYRVVAVNKAGPGKPSDPSDIAFAKPSKQAPSFELDIDGKEIRVHAGEPINFNVPYIGAPLPNVTWSRDGISVPDITSDGFKTTFYKEKSRRSDTGIYTIKLENDYGIAEAKVLISVVDKPGPPEPPIDFNKVTKRSIQFSWKEPKDDGGSPIIGYHVEFQEVGSNYWEKVSELIVNTQYNVRGLEHEQKYRFKITAKNVVGTSEPYITEPVTAKDPFDVPSAPSTPEVTEITKNSVSLEWNPPRDDGGSPITGYVVERFEKRGGGDWAPCRSVKFNGTNAVVTGLAEGETYQFRIRAVNAAGESPPSNSCQPVICEDQIYVPSSPESVKVAKTTNDSATITWLKPVNDGGSPIEGYIIEKRKRDSDNWERANGKLIKGNTYDVTNLKTGDEYEFRVIAVNKKGESKPSSATDMTKIQNAPGRPYFDLSGLKDITVKAGEIITFTLPLFNANPKPVCDVLNDNVMILEDDRTSVVVDDTKVTFTTTNAKISDAGNYKVIVQNRFGKDFAKLKVTVLDAPGKPTGPIKAFEVTGDSMTLAWLPPKNDGGGAITNYIVEKKNPYTGEWEKIGSPIGTTFKARNLDNGVGYEFRVSAENQYGISEPLFGDEPFIAKNPFDPPGPPGTPDCTTFSEDSIIVQWSRPSYDGGSPIQGYILEKRETGTNNWSKVTFANIYDTKYKVGGLIPQKSYEFRVCAVNAAGPGDYSNPSDSIVASMASCKPRVNLGALGHDITALAGEEVKILIPYAASPRPEITWSKGINQLSEMTPEYIIESSDYLTELKYYKVNKNDAGIYHIRIENDLGSEEVEIRLKVVDKPGIPEGPLEIDDICPETCTLSWKPPKDDGGSPITNYVVEKCHILKNGEEIWTKVSSFTRNTNIIVTGLEENERYKFRVFAENQYGLSQPLLSTEPIVAKYQFDVPSQPDPPSCIDFDSTWATVEWIAPSSNGGSKILGYNLQYRDLSSYKWINASTSLIDGTQFKVNNLRNCGEYEFRVIAKNGAGWSKASQPSDRIKLQQKNRVPDPPIQLHADSIGSNWVTLTWIAPVDNGGSKITHYSIEKREIGQNIWAPCNDYDVVGTEYTVDKLNEFHDYEFRVYAHNKSGKSIASLPSGPIKIQEQAGIKPEIVVKPVDTFAPYNKRVVLVCEAIGRPMPTCRWLKNGREIPNGARYRIENGEGTYKMVIKEAWDLDEGEYTCEVSNVFGTASASCYLKIQAPPVIERDVPNAIYPNGEMVRIKIYFSGSAPFKHSLKLNEDYVDLSNDNKIRLVDFDNHVLITIPSLTTAEAGRYEYTISNESGEASTGFWINVTGLPSAPQGPMIISNVNQHGCMLQWKPPSNDGGSRIIGYAIEKKDVEKEEWISVASSVKDLYFIVSSLFPQHTYDFRIMAVNENGQGPPLLSTDPVLATLPFNPPSPPELVEVSSIGNDYVTLKWNLPKDDGGGKIRGYIIEKKESNTDYWIRLNQNPLLVYNMDISSLIEGRKYDFRVYAVNDAGESLPCLLEDYTFIPCNEGGSPIITLELSDVYALQGTPATFNVEYESIQPATVQWFKGSKEIVNTTKYNIFDKGHSQTLIVNGISLDDVDEYSCRVSNKFGFKSTRASLKMKSKPRVFVPPKYITGLELVKDTDYEIEIPYKASPPGTATWYKNDEKIEDSSKYSMRMDDKSCYLKINKTARDDYGEYKLVLHNEVGSAEGQFNVIVSDVPDMPRFPVIENMLDEALILSWKAPKLDGGSPILRYIVEKRENGGMWSECGRTRYCCLTVEHLKPKNKYEFRIIAENKYGKSEPCEGTNVIEMPETKKRNKGAYKVDESGKLIRGEGLPLSNYDNFVIDVWKRYYPQPIEIKHDSIYDYYDVLEEIGTGAFGVVHRCVERATGNTFAAKFVNTVSDNEKDTVTKEIQVMSELRHPSLINLHDAFEDENQMAMIYEFMSGGELFEKVADDKNKMTEEEAKNYMKQICVALRHMHENNFVHLDLKPENIMFTTKKSSQLKLIDFGLTSKLDPKNPVKVTTGTAEFAAPEIASGNPVGYFTDMWSVGVLAYILLSGLSPFGGETDEETLKNVKNCDWNMDDSAFNGISDDGKDFIKRLLISEPEKRMNIHEAIDHPWFGTRKEGDTGKEIPAESYFGVRDKVRGRYDAWSEPNPPLGRVANFSSLKKHRPEEYHIHDAWFERSDAQPRFVIKPYSTSCNEGQSATFYCRVNAPSAPIVTWHKDSNELRQSVKYMKKYNGNDYALTINRVKMEDQGEYVVRAHNSYGSKEESCYLTVNKVSNEITIEPIEPKIRIRTPPKVQEIEENVSKPQFTFLLRPRLIQKHHQCKLICSVTGNPIPKIEWLKDGVPVNQDRVQLNYKAGVCSLEIFNAKKEDAGEYVCKATNELGCDETDCLVSVQERGETLPSVTSFSNFRHRRTYDTLRSDLDIERSRSSSNVRASAKYKDYFNNMSSSLITSSSSSSSYKSSTRQREYGSSRQSPFETIPASPNVTKDFSTIINGIDKTKSSNDLLVSHISPIVTNAGSSGTFTAIGKGKGIWMRNNKPIKVTDNCIIESDEYTHTLTFNNLKEEDSGIIQFDLISDENKSSSVGTLIVNGEKTNDCKVISLPQSITVTEDSFAKFVLEFENADNLTVQWFKDGEKVENNDYHKSVKSANTFKLDFKSTKQSDEGIYVVKVIKDKKAIAKYSVNLIVKA